MLKPLTVTILFLFSIHLSYGQMKFKKIKKNDGEWKYKLELPIKMKEEVRIDDSLSIILTDFTHKHQMQGGPTKATAYLTFIKANKSEEVDLSIHGTDGESKINYDEIEWNEYKIELNEFDYDHSVTITLHKKHK